MTLVLASKVGSGTVVATTVLEARLVPKSEAIEPAAGGCWLKLAPFTMPPLGIVGVTRTVAAVVGCQDVPPLALVKTPPLLLPAYSVEGLVEESIARV